MAVTPLLSDHGRLLIAVAEDSDRGIAQLAAAAALSQAAAAGMLAELVDAGYLRVEHTAAGTSHRLNSSARVSLTSQRRVALGHWAAAMLGGETTEGEKRVHPTRRDEVRDRLLIAVEALFERGETFAGLTVERLISEAGLSRSTFYTYFADKAELLQELAADVLEELFDAAAQWWERDQIASKADLHEGIRGVIVGFVNHRMIMRAISDAAATDATIGQRWVMLMKQSGGLVTRHIKMGQEAGFIDTDLDPGSVGTWLNWAAERALTMLIAPSDADEVERWHQVMTDLYWNLLYQEAS